MTKELTCLAPNCQFRIRSEDEEELASIVINHARMKHGVELTASYVKSQAKPV